MTDTTYRRVKILATLGPASEGLVEELILSGTDAFRLNFSHGDFQTHERLFSRIREAEKNVGRKVAILGDLPGPKLRIGDLPEEGLNLETGAEVSLGDGGDIPLQHPEIIEDLSPGEPVLLDDGKIRLAVRSVDRNVAVCEVLTGGVLLSHKGINLPHTVLRLPVMTRRDWDFVTFGTDLGVDYFALSFVQQASDIADLKKYSQGIPVIAKIERPAAVQRLEEILDVADGVMVARGDLGVEIGYEHVPVIQKRILAEARRRCRLSVTATQMLESMTHSPTPTRAEVSDVANAVLDRTGAVMLSGETAVGQYPVEAVSMMDRIIREVEGSRYLSEPALDDILPREDFTHSIARAAAAVVQERELKAIVVFSVTGGTAVQVAAFRPGVPVVAVTPSSKVLSRLSLVWGVVPLKIPTILSPADMVQHAGRLLVSEGIARSGDEIAVTFGFGESGPGRTNTLTLHRIP